MRISTLSYMTSSLPGILSSQSQIATLSQQIATGQKYLSSRDNPLAAQQAMGLSSSIATNTQYLVNQNAANQTLTEESTVLQGMQAALAGASSLLTQVNGSGTQDERNQTAATLANYYKQIESFANSQDTSGNYLFAGNNVKTQPFQPVTLYPASGTAPATPYTGTPDGTQLSSQGVRSVSIGNGISVQVSDNLQNVVSFPSQVDIPYSTAGSPPTVSDARTTDVLQALDQMSVALADPNISNGQVQAAMTGLSKAINSTLGRLQTVQSRVAVAQVQINDTQATTQSQLTNSQNALSKLTQVDQATAIVQQQTLMTSLQAAETAYAQTAKLSMFNYL